MPQENVELRRGRRINLQASVLLKPAAAGPAAPFDERPVGNISLAGVYFETEGANPYTMGDIVITSVAIPESQRRDFPFTRLIGRGRVVRVAELPPQDGRKRFGIALQFGADVTALTTVPSRS
jgi:hypothetical protein